ncbi:galactokinase [Aeromicrobium sp. CTD01-1L150]|uniref:galactokinase n=1 Tax=Aeromicrobium sp. CTD01-1L150 TaxID=3341830 RepID=UPI0035BFE398
MTESTHDGPTSVRRWQVPGRVNLVGEHLDYNGGPSLPFAIDRFLTVKARARDDDAVNAWSGGRKASFTTSVAPGDVDGWAAYVAGAVWAFGQAGHRLGGVDLVLEVDPKAGLPEGAGLSSSAALTVGVVSALDDLAGTGLDGTTRAVVAQRAENDFVGAPTGLMDQLAVVHGRAGHAVLTRPLADPPHTEPAPFDPPGAGLSLLVIDTGVDHSHAVHAETGGGYAQRREECGRAAAELGLEHLADAGLDAVLRLQDETLKARLRHVITETARVTAAVRTLRDGDWSQLGTILTASHESLRDDFEVSCAELDVAVEAALEAGALGARMTGGGFGGSAIALAPQPKAAAVRELIEHRYDALGWTPPTTFAVRAADGATRTH